MWQDFRIKFSMPLVLFPEQKGITHDARLHQGEDTVEAKQTESTQEYEKFDSSEAWEVHEDCDDEEGAGADHVNQHGVPIEVYPYNVILVRQKSEGREEGQRTKFNKCDMSRPTINQTLNL